MPDRESAEELLIRVMALHALAYCERLFYLEEVEEIRVADAAVYAGRALHSDLEEEDGSEWASMQVASDRLGLVGKVDCLRRRDGQLIPYEHKRGRAHWVDGEAGAWASDCLQVAAYGMLVEDQIGQRVQHCRIRYHADKVTIRVPLDEPARAGVLAALEKARSLRRSPDRPPVANNEHLCVRCSLAPVCLPEEERLAQDRNWKPIRLFPAESERKVVHVVEHAARVRREGQTLKITLPGKDLASYPVHDVGAVTLHGHAQISTQALHLCAASGVAVHWLTSGGRHVGALAAGSSPVQRRIRQYRALTDPGLSLTLARRTAAAKVESSLRYLLRATRGTDRAESGVGEALDTIRRSLKAIPSAEGIESVRGHEGAAARAYLGSLSYLLKPEITEEFRPHGRSRRPPRDRFNALLSFGYALLYNRVLQAILVVGLEPSLGFYHTPRSVAYPLVLDLMELFRVPIWDTMVVGSINRLQWNPDEDYDLAKEHVWLSATGRKKAIGLFERRLSDKWRHPVIGYSLSYARLIELEARLLEKEWAGQPGLYGRMRLR